MRPRWEEEFAGLPVEKVVDGMKNRSILLTGATGFFGKWILSLFRFLNQTHNANIRVYALSRSVSEFFGREPSYRNVEWLHWLEGDVRTFEWPFGALDDIIHAATDTSAAAGQRPRELFDTIVHGTRNVLDQARTAGCRRILLVSSGAVYGKQPADVLRMSEESGTAPNPLDLASAYGEGKRAMELLGAIHAHETGAKVVSARCFAFVGAGLPLDAHFAIGNFIRDALYRPEIVVNGGGVAERSYLYAADLAIWLSQILIEGRDRTTYNVGSDQAVSILELARLTASVLSPGKAIRVNGAKDSNTAANRYIPSIDRARSELGLDVWTDLRTAIARTASLLS
jgi:nucleoside-diphosphate-sugar epimerase